MGTLITITLFFSIFSATACFCLLYRVNKVEESMVLIDEFVELNLKLKV